MGVMSLCLATKGKGALLVSLECVSVGVKVCILNQWMQIPGKFICFRTTGLILPNLHMYAFRIYPTIYCNLVTLTLLSRPAAKIKMLSLPFEEIFLGTNG